jgi:adenylate cyclase
VAQSGDEVQATGVSMGMADAFISYASPDIAVANAVVAALESHGIRCWVAPRDVTPGALYADEIIRSINKVRAFVLVLSANAVASPHVGKEVERASSKRRPIITLKVDSTSLTTALEYFLSESQWVDVQHDGTEAAFAKLVAAVQRQLTPTSSEGDRAQIMPATHERHTAVVRPTRRWVRRSLATGAVIAVIVAFSFLDKPGLSKRSARQPAVVSTTSTPALVTLEMPEKSVAVLPFVDMSQTHDQEYFSDGLSEELIDMLAKVPELRVPARTSSFFFKGKQVTVVDIARQLGVAHLLEGSVRKSGNRLRVTAQLIRADNGYHLWSETYDRQLDDVFKVQDEIATAVVSALKVSLLESSITKSAGTENIEAYNFYLQARSIYLRANTQSDYQNVVEYLHRALLVDPKFANAWASLSIALAVGVESFNFPAKPTLDEARDAARRAIELNPKLAEARTALARLLMIDELDIRGGGAALQQALQLDGKNSLALALSSDLAAQKGDFEKAIELVSKSIAVDPVNPIRYRDLAWTLFFARKYDDALIASRRLLDLKPGDPSVPNLIALVALATGDPARALAEIDGDALLSKSCGCRVLALDALGRNAEADAALTALQKSHANDNAYDIGIIYANRGDLDHAFTWFDRAYNQRESEMGMIKVNPLLKNAQADPRFSKLLQKMDLLD